MHGGYWIPKIPMIGKGTNEFVVLETCIFKCYTNDTLKNTQGLHTNEVIKYMAWEGKACVQEQVKITRVSTPY